MRENPVFRYFFVALTLIAVNRSAAQTPSTFELQRAFTDLRFGGFYHFGIMTFTGAPWATANQDISQFNPTDLDCNQWAAAAAAAKMKCGILTTKHHDGFCLWDSRYTDYDVANTPWKDGHGDVVREFVDAFRAQGLEPCLYYSVWDNTHGVGNDSITAADLDFIKGQLTEILTGYGPIELLFIDGWSWKMGHRAVPYDEILALVKSLQPGCLLVDNTHLQCLYDNEMIHYEAGGVCPTDNTLPALQSALINKSGGNDWFWAPAVPTAPLMSVSEIVDGNLRYLEPRWCTFILNCPPNTAGKIDDNIVRRLTEVGQAWSPDPDRPQLPPQPPQIDRPIPIVAARATSGNATAAIDGINDRYFYSVWESDPDLPQAITLDLGTVCDTINTLYYVPKYQTVTTPVEDGSITAYKLYTSTDNEHFTEIAAGRWNGDTAMKVVTFPAVAVRYLRLEALAAVNDHAAATEIAAGIATSVLADR